MPTMPCDVLEAIEDAAFEYLERKLIRVLLRLIGKRAAAALTALLVGIFADGPAPVGDIIGLLVSIGIAIWTIYDVIKTIREVIDGFRSGFFKTLKRMARMAVEAAYRDCIDSRPECCLKIKDLLRDLLMRWVRSLGPNWKRRPPGGHVLVHRQKNRLRESVTEVLKECCED